MEDESAEWKVPSTAWVKGELLNDLSSATADPRGLLARNPTNTLFERLEWFRKVQDQAAEGDEPLIARAWSQGQHLWLFLSVDADGKASALANWYSMAFRPIFAEPTDDATKRVLVTALAKRLGKAKRPPHQIILSPVPRADGSSDLIMRAFAKSGWHAMRRQSSTSWTANVAGLSFDEYWAARPGQLRNTYQRKLKKSEVETEILTCFDDQVWADYESVYADSWKPPEGDIAFLRDLAKSESAAGNFRLGLARLDGLIVAAQFWTVENGIAYIHKLAHRESAKEHSPGTILSVALFRHVIDIDQVDTIDFGTGNDAYKADWMDASAPLDTIMLYNKRTALGWLGAARTRISALVRKQSLD
jgi:hypothetical protein